MKQLRVVWGFQHYLKTNNISPVCVLSGVTPDRQQTVSTLWDPTKHSIIPLNISFLESGVYVIKFEIDKESIVKKLIIANK